MGLLPDELVVPWKIRRFVFSPSSILQPPLLHSQKTFVLPACHHCQTCPLLFLSFSILSFYTIFDSFPRYIVIVSCAGALSGNISLTSGAVSVFIAFPRPPHIWTHWENRDNDDPVFDGSDHSDSDLGANNDDFLTVVMRKLFPLPHLEAAKNQNSFWVRQLVRQRWENDLFDCSFLCVSFNFAVVASSRLDITPRF